MQPGDEQLLARFLQDHDEIAFEELVKRHAPMVMAVCRRTLRDTRDAEEAFQNTFMALVRKRGQCLRLRSVGGWLYHVAVRRALDIQRARMAREARFETREDIEMIADRDESSAEVWEAMKGVLDKELDQLAERYRLPLVLCYMQGMSTEEAALELGWKYSTFRGRLERGRELLRRRLVRRGVAVSAGTLGTVLVEQVAQATEVVSEVLIQTTVKSAMALLSTVSTAGILAGGLKLLKGALLAMTMKQTAAVIGGLVLVGLIGTLPVLISKKSEHQTGQSKAVSTQATKTALEGSATAKPSDLSPAKGTEEDIAMKEQKSERKATISEFQKWFIKGMKAQGTERWRIFRELGIDLTDEEFEAAWATALNDKRNSISILHVPGLSFEEVSMLLRLQDAIFCAWLEMDPLAIMEWVKNLPPGNYYASYDKNRFNFSSPTMFGPSLEAGQYGTKQELCTALIALWSQKDMNSAVKWADELPRGQDREAAFFGITLTLSGQNAKGAVELMKKEKLMSSPQLRHSDYIKHIVSNWILSNAAEAAEYLKSLPEQDPEGYKEWFKHNGMRLLGSEWAKADLQGALERAETLSDVERNPVMSGIVEEWARKDLPAARDYVTAMWARQDSENNYQMLWNLAGEWLKKDPQACAEWAMQLPDKYDPKKRIPNSGYGQKENICQYICQGWAMKDPEAVFDWIGTLPPSKLKIELWEAAAGGLVFTMCQGNEFSSLQEGAGLIAENLPEECRRSSYQYLVKYWVRLKSPYEAINWVRTLPNNDDKDMLISMCCAPEQTSYPESLQWASEIQGSKFRLNWTKYIFQGWFHKDPAAAKQWLQDSSLPQDTKDKLLVGK